MNHLQFFLAPVVVVAILLTWSSDAFTQESPELVRTPVIEEKPQPESDLHTEEMKVMKQRVEKLRAEYNLVIQEQKRKLAELEAEINRLDFEQRLLGAKAKGQSASGNLEISQLNLQNTLRHARFNSTDEVLEANEEMIRLKLDADLREARETRDRADEMTELSTINLNNDLQESRQKTKHAALQMELIGLNLEMKLREVHSQSELSKMRIEISKLKVERELEAAKAQTAQAKYDREIAEMSAEAKFIEQKDQWQKLVTKGLVYRKEPYQDGVLHISDRRIRLNYAIIRGTADYVTERIHYYNNKSIEHPIFIVIDGCYGGSVMEGYRILQAMKNSKAPIYVVVKQFAYSMAAIITTVAERSFAYPNAIILHHQLSAGMWGNLTDQKEQLEILQEWSSRIMGPVVKKIGLTEKEFIAQMYENNSRGDWEEFADSAQKIKWVNHIVNEIREDGIVRQPTEGTPEPSPLSDGSNGKVHVFSISSHYEHRDAEDRRYVTLPRLDPFDFYYIYNPDNYFR